LNEELVNLNDSGKPASRGHLAHLSSYRDLPIVFFTVTTHNRSKLLNSSAVHEILGSIWKQSSHRNGWFVGDYLLMPEHVHLFARPCREAEPMKEWIKMWKSLSSRLLTKALMVKPPVWQADYFDRYLRSGESYAEKWAYVERNPVRAGLVLDPQAWPYRGRIHNLAF